MMMSSAAWAQIIDIEDFGTGVFPGAPLPAGQTSYNFNAPPQPANFPDILADGDYVIATNSQQGFTSWASIGDNTTGTGYMMLVNADDNQSGEFYRREVALSSNTSFDFLASLVTVNSQGDFDFCTANAGGLVLPNVTLQIESNAGDILASFDTGDIPFNPTPEWEEYSLTFTTSATTTDVNVVLINNSLGGCGNDLAIDDIIFRVAVTMEAFDDSTVVTDTSVAQTAVLNLGANDTLDGNPVPGTVLYSVASGSSLPAGLSLNPNTGAVSVAAGTPDGTLSFDYQICETNNGFNCDTATATLVIDNPPLPITANNDNGTVSDSSVSFTSVLNVLDNDSIDGVSPPSEFALSLADGSVLPSGITFNLTTGAVGVLQGTATDIYSFDYNLCEFNDLTNCETATVVIDVTNPGGASVCPAGTLVVSGTFHVVSATGGQNPDRAVGVPSMAGDPATDANSALTFFDTITMDLTGQDGVVAPEGEVIQVLLASHFGTAARAEILMSPDGVTYTSLGTTGQGGSVYGSLLSNIFRSDAFTVPSGGARFLQVDHQNSGVRADGVVYNTQCQPAPISVSAENDNESVETSITEQVDILSVVDNDTFNGLTPSSFDLSVNSGSSLPPELTFDLTSGTVSVVAGAPEGVYSFDYDICETGTSNCDTATVTVTITAPVTTTLEANKSVNVYDPDGLGLYLLPGNDAIYTINIANTGAGNVDADSLLLIDVMPGEIEFYNDDIDGLVGTETDPVSFTDNGSGLTFNFATDVAFSDASAKPADFLGCSYSPLSATYDPSVTFICFNPKGVMLAGSNVSLNFRARLK